VHPAEILKISLDNRPADLVNLAIMLRNILTVATAGQNIEKKAGRASDWLVYTKKNNGPPVLIPP